MLYCKNKIRAHVSYIFVGKVSAVAAVLFFAAHAESLRNPRKNAREYKG